MRLPRDVSGDELARALGDLGHRITRQTGSHLRLTILEGGEHHVIETTDPRGVTFEAFRDFGNRVAEDYGLVFTLPDDLREIYLKLGIDLAPG